MYVLNHFAGISVPDILPVEHRHLSDEGNVGSVEVEAGAEEERLDGLRHGGLVGDVNVGLGHVLQSGRSRHFFSVRIFRYSCLKGGRRWEPREQLDVVSSHREEEISSGESGHSVESRQLYYTNVLRFRVNKYLGGTG